MRASRARYVPVDRTEATIKVLAELSFSTFVVSLAGTLSTFSAIRGVVICTTTPQTSFRPTFRAFALALGCPGLGLPGIRWPVGGSIALRP